jgi:hypothetical protein
MMDLTATLHQLADRDDVGAPPIGQLIRDGQRAKRSRALVAVSTTAATGALAAVAVTLAASVPAASVPAASVPAGPGDTTRAAAAAGDLKLAAQTTEQDSFRFDITDVVVFPSSVPHPPGLGALRMSGAYDPVNHRGYLNSGGGDFQERQIGGDCYLRSTQGPWPNQWQATSGRCLTAGPEMLPETLGYAVSPVTLLDHLKDLGTVAYNGRTGSGSKAVDTYTFSYQEPFADGGTGTFSGTVEVGVGSGRIATVKVHEDIRQPRSRPGVVTPSGNDLTIKFSDYGTTAANVSRPDHFVPSDAPVPSGTPVPPSPS